MSGVMIAIGPCWIGGHLFEYDVDRVTTVLIDPETSKPPDVDANNLPIPSEQVSPAAISRSVARPICPEHCKEINEDRAEMYPDLERLNEN